MAGERTFTEGEAYALVADAVERETAAANTRIAELEAQVTTLGNEKDATEVRATAAEEKAEQSDQALTDYKAEVDNERQQAAALTERVAKLAEVAPKLVENIDEEAGAERRARILAMDDASFDEYLGDLRQLAGATAGGDTSTATTDPTTGKPVPRESAAFQGGTGGGDASKKPSVGGMFAARKAASAPAKV